MAKVFIGVDPHKLSATIEVVDDHETVLATGRFATDKAGYAAMRKHVAGVAGAGLGGRGQQRRRPPAGAAAARRRRARRRRAGEAVRPGAAVRHRPQPQDRRPRRARDRGGRGAHQGAAGAGLRRRARGAADAGRPPRRADPAPGPDRQPAAPAAVRTGSGTGARRTSPPARPRRCSPRSRPRDMAGKTRRRLAAEQLAELVAVEKKIKAPTTELKAMVLARGSTLMDLPGVGPVVAARILADVGDVARFADRNRFASWTGTAPLGRLLRGADPAPALPGREPADEPHDPHRRGHPDPPRHRRAGPTTGASSPPARPAWKPCAASSAGSPTPSTASSSPTPSAAQPTAWTRAREGTAGRHINPARPARTRTPALRISHFPDPHQRRYPRRPRHGRPPGPGPCNPPLDIRGEPK